MERLTNRQLKAQQTKKRILETALMLFKEKGYDNVTVDEIVAASQTSKGAFYGHFNSKYEIFLEKFREVDHFYKNIQKELPNSLTAQEKVTRLTVAQMIYFRDEMGKELLRTLYSNMLTPGGDNFLSDTARPLYAILEQFIEEGQQSGEIPENYCKKKLTLIISRCMRGTLYDWFIFGDDYDLIEEVERFLDVIFTGIKNKPH